MILLNPLFLGVPPRRRFRLEILRGIFPSINGFLLSLGTTNRVSLLAYAHLGLLSP